MIFGNDFLKDDYSNKHYDAIVTNPPFSLWDNFVGKAKQISDKVVMIGRTNYWEHIREMKKEFGIILKLCMFLIVKLLMIDLIKMK